MTLAVDRMGINKINPEIAAHNIAAAFCAHEVQKLPESAFVPGYRKTKMHRKRKKKAGNPENPNADTPITGPFTFFNFGKFIKQLFFIRYLLWYIHSYHILSLSPLF